MKTIFLIVSFLLDGILSRYLPIHGFFTPLFTLISLITVYPLFNGDKTSYYKYAFVMGLAYDLLYTDTIIVHAFLFLVMAFIITKMIIVLSDNYINLTITSIICIIIYRFLEYGLLLMTGNMVWNFSYLLASVYNSLILNIIYSVLSSMIISFISMKLKAKRRRFI